MSGELELFNLQEIERDLAKNSLDDARVAGLSGYCAKARRSTDKAVMFRGPVPLLGYRGGMAHFSMLCLTEPEHIKQLHEIITLSAIENMRRLIPKIAPHVDIIMLSSDDQGTQSGPILPPAVYRELFVPYYKRVNDVVHELAPEMKIFLHSCGAIYDLLDDVIDAGFDVLNPIQWSAGRHGFGDWKAKCRGRLAMWGGGARGQSTLPFGTVEDVRREVSEVAPCLAEGSGFVFCAIHNLLAEVQADKIITMYRSARESVKESLQTVS